MRLALPVGVALLGSVTLVVACVGGPGSADQGGENGDQYGGIRVDTSGSRGGNGSQSNGDVDTTPVPSATAPKVEKPKDLKASDYDQSCSTDTDCLPIYEGDACTVCKCSNAAIATKDSSKYSSASSAALVACLSASSSSSGGVSCAPCTSQGAYCNGGKRCTFGTNPTPPGGSSGNP